jgi:hypothetical protein
MLLRDVAVVLSLCTFACDGDGPGTPTSESRAPNAAEPPVTTPDAGPPDAATSPDASPPDAAPGAVCASAPVERFVGTASRKATNYPDNIAVDVTWKRVSTEGCVDRYAPTGTAQYQFAIPGALCAQTVAPDTTSVTAADGTLAVDRTVTPAHYTASGSTTWTVTWTCTQAGGTVDTQTFEAGQAWMLAEGEVVGGVIAGQTVVEDGTQCGNGNSSLPCTYDWSFTAAP